MCKGLVLTQDETGTELESKPLETFVAIGYCYDIQSHDQSACAFLFEFNFSSNPYTLYFTKVSICDKLEIYKTWSFTTDNLINTILRHYFSLGA